MLLILDLIQITLVACYGPVKHLYQLIGCGHAVLTEPHDATHASGEAGMQEAKRATN